MIFNITRVLFLSFSIKKIKNLQQENNTEFTSKYLSTVLHIQVDINVYMFIFGVMNIQIYNIFNPC